VDADHVVPDQDADRAQRRRAAIVEASDDAIIRLTTAGVVATWNESADWLFDYNAEEAVGNGAPEPAGARSRRTRGDVRERRRREWAAADGWPEHAQGWRPHARVGDRLADPRPRGASDRDCAVSSRAT
jgi:PAS domain-containing protein